MDGNYYSLLRQSAVRLGSPSASAGFFRQVVTRCDSFRQTVQAPMCLPCCSSLSQGSLGNCDGQMISVQCRKIRIQENHAVAHIFMLTWPRPCSTIVLLSISQFAGGRFCRFAIPSGWSTESTLCCFRLQVQLTLCVHKDHLEVPLAYGLRFLVPRLCNCDGR